MCLYIFLLCFKNIFFLMCLNCDFRMKHLYQFKEIKEAEELRNPGTLLLSLFFLLFLSFTVFIKQ